MKDLLIAILISIFFSSFSSVILALSLLDNDNIVNLTRKRYDAIINSSLSEPNDISNDAVIDEHLSAYFLQ